MRDHRLYASRIKLRTISSCCDTLTGWLSTSISVDFSPWGRDCWDSKSKQTALFLVASVIILALGLKHVLTHTYYIAIYMHTYVPTYIHSYIHTYIRTYIHTYIHTYVHTCISCVYTDVSLSQHFKLSKHSQVKHHRLVNHDMQGS